MNGLFATWHSPKDVDIVEQLSGAQRQLIDIPALESALWMVDAALAEVLAWYGLPAVPDIQRAHATSASAH